MVVSGMTKRGRRLFHFAQYLAKYRRCPPPSYATPTRVHFDRGAPSAAQTSPAAPPTLWRMRVMGGWACSGHSSIKR